VLRPIFRAVCRDWTWTFRVSHSIQTRRSLMGQADTYHSCYLTTFPGLEARLVSYGIAKRLVGSYQPPSEKQPRLIHNSKKRATKILRSLDSILRSTPRLKSISQLVVPKKRFPKSLGSQMIYSPAVFRPHSESHCCITTSRLSPSWPLDMIELSPKELRRTWKRFFTVCRADSKRGCGRRCRLY